MEKYILLTSGRGPRECNLAVKLVLERMRSEAKQYGLKMETVEAEEIDGLPCSLVLKLTGEAISVFIDRWIGTICWICPSPFRPNHRRKNWFFGGQELVSGTACCENELEGCAISGDAQQWRRWTACKQGEFSSSRDSPPDRNDGTGDGYPFPITK